MDLHDLGATVVFVSAFLALDGVLATRLYRGEPENPNFRPWYRMARWHGKWALRLAAVAIPVGLLMVLIGAVT